MSILDKAASLVLKKGAALALFLFFFSGSAALAHEQEVELELSHRVTLHGGWYPFEPFQFETQINGIKTLTGLDYELVNAIAKAAEINLEYKPISWTDLLQGIKTGKEDFATGCLFSKERADFAYYSIPYRYTQASIFLPQGKVDDLSHKSRDQMLDYIKQNKFKLAVVKGFVYSGTVINQFINDPANRDFIIKTQSDNDSLDRLNNGEVDGFLADRIVGSYLIWHSNPPEHIIEYRLKEKSPIYILFSRKSVPLSVVDQINKSIQKIRHTETYENIISWYLYPAIVFQIRGAPWFKITEILGTVAFAISGLLIAFREKTTLFGALILAILPSLGGGLIRDVIFGQKPVGALQSPIYLATVLLTVFTGFVIIKVLSFYRKKYEIPREMENSILKHVVMLLTITDAIGLATFTVTGVMVSLLAKASPLWLWGPFFAFVTGAGGGILRDILSKSRYIEALEGEFYGELAVIWGFFLSVYILLSTNQGQPEYIEYAVILTIMGVFISRLLIHFLRVPNVRFKQLDQ